MESRLSVYLYLFAGLLPLIYGDISSAALNEHTGTSLIYVTFTNDAKGGNHPNTPGISFHSEVQPLQRRQAKTITITSTSTDTTDCGCTESTAWVSTASVSSSLPPALTTTESTAYESPIPTVSTVLPVPVPSTTWTDSAGSSAGWMTPTAGGPISTVTVWATRTAYTTTTDTITDLSTISVMKSTTVTLPVVTTVSEAISDITTSYITASYITTSYITTSIRLDGNIITIPTTRTILRTTTATATDGRLHETTTVTRTAATPTGTQQLSAEDPTTVTATVMQGTQSSSIPAASGGPPLPVTPGPEQRSGTPTTSTVTVDRTVLVQESYTGTITATAPPPADQTLWAVNPTTVTITFPESTQSWSVPAAVEAPPSPVTPVPEEQSGVPLSPNITVDRTTLRQGGYTSIATVTALPTEDRNLPAEDRTTRAITILESTQLSLRPVASEAPPSLATPVPEEQSSVPMGSDSNIDRTARIQESYTGTLTAIRPTGASSTPLSTEQVPTLSICPTRVTNPTYTPPTPLPTDYTWGCPPGYLCHPRKTALDGHCNFEAGPPADTYICRPEECIPRPPLLSPQYWGTPVWSNEISTFNISPGYFNLNPSRFGLTYGIFRFPIGHQLGSREQPATVPGQCYDECNDAMLEAESEGKTRQLCHQGSPFKQLLHDCQSCQGAFNNTRTQTSQLPDFQQFLHYCDTLPGSSSTPSPSTRTGATAKGVQNSDVADYNSLGALSSMPTTQSAAASTGPGAQFNRSITPATQRGTYGGLSVSPTAVSTLLSGGSAAPKETSESGAPVPPTTTANLFYGAATMRLMPAEWTLWVMSSTVLLADLL